MYSSIAQIDDNTPVDEMTGACVQQ